MYNAPFDEVHIDSEVEELRAIVLHSPGDAHRNIMPEHIDAHLSLKELLFRQTRIEAEELDSLMVVAPGQEGRINILADSRLELQYRTRDGHEGALAIGRALEQLLAANPQYLLFDDIIDMEHVQREYHQFERVVSTVAPHTFKLSGLIHDALHRVQQDKALADEFFARLRLFSLPEERPNIAKSRDYLNEFGVRRFLKLIITGRDHLNTYVFQPLPNLLFTRDLASTVGRTIVVNCAMKPTRQREMVLAWLVFNHHPVFTNLVSQNKMHLIDMLKVRMDHPHPEQIAIEGGDIIHLGNKSLAIGIGERTTHAGAIALAQQMWGPRTDGSPKPDTGIERIIMVDIMAQRSSMHLDTIFTLAYQSGHDTEAMVYGPWAQGGGHGDLVAHEMTPDLFTTPTTPDLNDIPTYKRSTLSHLLRDTAGLRMRPLYCGGQRLRPKTLRGYWTHPEEVFRGPLPHEIDAKREQWTDGANLFCLAPGIVLTYARNRASLMEMSERNFQVIDIDHFIANSPYYLKRCHGPNRIPIAIPIGGSELSRGRGGPRCMTLPLLRRRTSRTG